MRINVFGDVMFGRNVAESINHGVDLLSEIRGRTGENNFNICNLEAPYIRNNPYNPTRFFFTEMALPTLQHFQAVTLANNHVFDQGLDGLYETIEILDKLHIQHTGIGMNKEDAFRPILINVKGISVALLGITSKKNIMKAAHVYLNYIALIEDDEKIESFVREYKQRGSYLIVLPHMGIEHVDCPSEYIKEKYRRLIDIGFDMVIASHPHAVQGVEEYREKIICYSLGDFIFDNLSSLRNKSMVVSLDFSVGDEPQFFFSVTHKNSLFQPTIMTEEQAFEMKRRLNSYINSEFAFQIRLVICKIYNQIYNITYIKRTQGWKSTFASIREKIFLLIKD